MYESHLEQLQQTLLKDGCYLLGVKNRDHKDLALAATASASSQTAAMPAGKVINGCNRAVGKDRNAWAPDSAASGPQWVQLQLSRAATVDSVHVTFRAASDDCRVEVLEGETWKTVATIERGRARRTVLQFSPVKTDKLRLLLDNPSQQTAVCEVRVYHEGVRSYAALPSPQGPAAE